MCHIIKVTFPIHRNVEVLKINLNKNKSVALWPNGTGTRLRIWGLQVPVLPRLLIFHLTVRNAKGFGQKYIKKRTNYHYMAMGHVPHN